MGGGGLSRRLGSGLGMGGGGLRRFNCRLRHGARVEVRDDARVYPQVEVWVEVC